MEKSTRVDELDAGAEAIKRAYRIGYTDGVTKAMSQTSIIAAALIVGFIVYITIKGELPKYLSVVGI